MARFRGTIKSDGKESSRLGTKNGGLETNCNGWNLGARVNIEYNEDKDRDEITLTVNTGSNYHRVLKDLGTFYITNRGTIAKIK